MSDKALLRTIIGCTIAIIATIVITSEINHRSEWNHRQVTTYTLNVITDPLSGGNVSQIGGAPYLQGTNATLTATPVPGYRFDHWLINGQVSNLSATITIPMVEHTDVVAVFVPETNPPIQVALDFFAVKDTRWISQIGGEPKARIQLVVLIRDRQGTLDAFTIPEAGVGGFYMDFFQVIALEDYMNPTIFTGTPTGSLTVSVAAYNINKGPITKAQIDFFSTWTGTDWSALKYFVKDQELVGSCWYTWSASDNFGAGTNYLLDDGNLKLWLRVGSAQTMPDPVTRPVLKPNVEIVGKLPTDAKVRTQFYYNAESFTFTLTNHESFAFPIFWRVETDSNPGTTINYIIHPTEGWLTVQGGSTKTVTYPYWFTTPGEYEWKYIAEYPKGTPIASWQGTLTVAP